MESEDNNEHQKGRQVHVFESRMQKNRMEISIQSENPDFQFNKRSKTTRKEFEIREMFSSIL